jgi:hypothetical protein
MQNLKLPEKNSLKNVSVSQKRDEIMNTGIDKNIITEKKRFGLRERGKRNDLTLLAGGIPSGGNSNPGASIADIYDMYYIKNDEIPPQHNLNKLDFIRVLRKKKKSKKPKSKRCKCK